MLKGCLDKKRVQTECSKTPEPIQRPGRIVILTMNEIIMTFGSNHGTPAVIDKFADSVRVES